MISSTSNNQIKQVIALSRKSKARREQDLFVVEGIKMYLELPKDRIEKIFVSDSFLRSKENYNVIQSESYEVVSDDVFRFMSDTQTPQGILALVKQYHYTLEDILMQRQPAHLMILETIQDPGNLGTILRAGEGAGITGIIMNRSTADIYNPKVIRSTMGSIYRVPFIYADDLKEILTLLKSNQTQLFAAHLNGENNYEEEDYTGNIGFLIGNEANGLSEDITSFADTYIKIPMAGNVESLNAAVAASILMFEASRQRRRRSC